MNRRAVIVGALAALAVSRVATAQQSRRVPKVGVMLAQPIPNAFMEAFRQGLRELGYLEGKSIQVEYRSAEGSTERFAEIAGDIVRLKPEVIVAGGGGAGIRAAMKATDSIPIVFPLSGDPIGNGFVQSLARPGGNVTGLAMLDNEMSAKRLQLLKEVMPKVKRVAALWDSGAAFRSQLAPVEEAARSLGIQLQLVGAARPEEYAAAFGAARRGGAEAFIALASSSFSPNRQQLVDLAAQNRMATVWEHRIFTDAGGLLSYGPDIAHMYRAAARYVDRILKGARPADLPVEVATKFDLVINLKTARALGVTIPPSLLVRADQVIE